ncbi:hypothetical protein GCM10010176_024110 [Nonomuraea spiralis]|nr:hypothetical protein GCM10010176_024110 [Nonomuraea spiralis]
MLHTTPPTEADKIDTVRLCGTLILLLGLALCGGALFIAEGEPPWQVLGVFMLVVLVGLTLRIEAAVRHR